MFLKYAAGNFFIIFTKFECKRYNNHNNITISAESSVINEIESILVT